MTVVQDFVTQHEEKEAIQQIYRPAAVGGVSKETGVAIKLHFKAVVD